MSKQKGNAKTPIRIGLVPSSRLLALVVDGIQAMEGEHINSHLDPKIRTEFSDSLDIDAAFLNGHEQEHRWDYLLGHKSSGEIVALEPHSAKTGEITTIIAKREAALLHLHDHLKEGVHVIEWFWVASGGVDFADTEKAKLRLNQNGITFVGRKVLEKHLLKVSPAKSHSKRNKR